MPRSRSKSLADSSSRTDSARIEEGFIAEGVSKYLSDQKGSCDQQAIKVRSWLKENLPYSMHSQGITIAWWEKRFDYKLKSYYAGNHTAATYNFRGTILEKIMSDTIL